MLSYFCAYAFEPLPNAYRYRTYHFQPFPLSMVQNLTITRYLERCPRVLNLLQSIEHTRFSMVSLYRFMHLSWRKSLLELSGIFRLSVINNFGQKAMETAPSASGKEGRGNLPSELGFALAHGETDPTPVVTRSSEVSRVEPTSAAMVTIGHAHGMAVKYALFRK